MRLLTREQNWLALLLCLTVSACIGDRGEGELLIVDAAAPPKLVTASVVEASALPSVDRTLPFTPRLLGRVQGRVAIFGEVGGSVLDALAGGFNALAGATAEGDALTLTPIHAAAVRDSGASLLAGAGVLYNDAPAGLLRAPVSEQLGDLEVRALDSVGEGDAEEVWLLTADGARSLFGGRLATFTIEGVAPPTHLLALGGRQVLLVGPAGAFTFSPTTRVATREVSQVGNVTAVARLTDGRSFVASDLGLFERAADGSWTRHDFSSPVVNVAGADERLFLVVEERVLELSASGFLAVGAVPPGGDAMHLTLDGAGDVFVSRGASLRQLQRSGGVSFAAHVAPFLETHCVSCHATGLAGAPEVDLLNHALASTYSDNIARRLTDPVNPMPPRGTEELVAADYAVVLRWINGGKLP